MADDRLTTLISNLPPNQAYFSLEFFPPKTQSGFTNLQSRLARMAAGLRPLFVTVTWGAGGSTSSKSLELAEVCQRQLNLPTVLHLTCTNMKKKMVDEALEACKELGIRNILALRGDPPREEYREDDSDDGNWGEDFIWAIDLVRYIRKNHGDHFCIGVAGYPEGHADESNPEAGKQSIEHDLPYLVEKVKAGANFIMTQLTYDVDAYAKYEARLRGYQEDGKYLFERIPIIPGLMPIQSYQIVKRITKLSHARLPSSISHRIEQFKSNDEAVKKAGVDILSDLVEGIKALPQPKGLPRGLHFYTLNLEKSVSFILERCNLIPPVREPSPEESSDSDAIVDDDKKIVNGIDHPSPRFSRRRASSVNAQPHNRVIVDSRSPDRPRSRGDQPQVIQHEARERGTGIPASDPSRKHSLLISEGQGSLGREATWDDFPNGRFGPATSAAYGEFDGYGPTLKVGPATARKLWGHPQCADDITRLFARHISGEVQALPFSDSVDPDGVIDGAPALRAETSTVKDVLLALIEKKCYWTVASQPAVDGVKSDDPIFGWGPPGQGYVWQKPFCEFFCFKQEWEAHLKPKLISTPIEEVSWMKTDVEGVYESTETLLNGQRKQGTISSKTTPGTSGVNAVTWGCFRSREIVSTTIIESESFRAWSDEAFQLFVEWARAFPKGSPEEIFLKGLRKDLVLVNVVGQVYSGSQQRRMWELLLDD